jgi:protocatechuate 3,4-dioxygenase beta subunit
MFRSATAVAMAGLLASAVAASACTTGQSPSTSVTGPPGASAPATTGTAEGTDLTVGTTEGPYYISGTPALDSGELNYSGLDGDPIRITGHVYGGTGTSTPLPNATVEIWHADDAGSYHPNSNGDTSQYSADQIALRGYVVTDETGAYAFTSIYPGYYQGRTRHIHVRVSAEGYGSVATQIIVPSKTGDGTTPETDMIAQSLPEANFVTFADVEGAQTGTFDAHLGPD